MGGWCLWKVRVGVRRSSGAERAPGPGWPAAVSALVGATRRGAEDVAHLLDAVLCPTGLDGRVAASLTRRAPSLGACQLVTGIVVRFGTVVAIANRRCTVVNSIGRLAVLIVAWLGLLSVVGCAERTPTTPSAQNAIAVTMTPSNATLPVFSVGTFIHARFPCKSDWGGLYFVRDDGSRLIRTFGHSTFCPEPSPAELIVETDGGVSVLPLSFGNDPLYDFGRGHALAVWYVLAHDQAAVDRLLAQATRPDPATEFHAQIGTINIPNDSPIVWGYIMEEGRQCCPLSGFSVEVIDPPNSVAPSGTTDLSVFRFRKVPNGTVTLRATHPDYNPVQVRVTVSGTDVNAGYLRVTRR